jgi:hypothetical protein
MIALVAFALAGQLSPAPPVIVPPPPPPPPPVAEWPQLPSYPLPRSANIADGVDFVRREVDANRCQPLLPPAAGERLQLPVAILVGQGGQVRQIVPRAIGCPSVEQYVVGYLLSLTRTAAQPSMVPVPGWYQLTVAYRW